MPVSFEDIMSDLKKKIYKPIYFLAGEEPYYIDLITDYIEENVLPESEKAFNQITFYGEDTNVASITETSRRFPMMANHQVVIIREAQTLKKIEDLIHYVEKPLKSTILVINFKYKTLDKRTKLHKTLDSLSSYFESPRIKDYQVPAWIERYLMVKGIKAEANAAALLRLTLTVDDAALYGASASDCANSCHGVS